MGNFAAMCARLAARTFLVLGFVGTLAGFSYRTFTHVIEHADALPAVAEPDQSWSRLHHNAKKFPQQFESFFDTNTAWRDIQVRRFARFKMNRLGVSPTPRVWFGSDGWLFYNHEADNIYVAADDPKLDRRLADWVRAMSEWRVWLAERNITLLMVVVPDKQSVYTDELPAWVRKTRPEKSPLDRLMAGCGDTDPKLEVLDLRAPLRAARGDRPLYYQTDTHWSLYGARVGYQATARGLGQQPRSDSDFQLVDRQKKTGDLGFRLLGYFPRGDEEFDNIDLSGPSARPMNWDDADDGSRLDYLKAMAWENPEAGGGKCLLFHDSFGHSFYAKLLAEHFDRLAAVPSNHLDPKLIEREQPNVVILEIAERLLQAINPRRPTDPPRRSVTK